MYTHVVIVESWARDGVLGNIEFMRLVGEAANQAVSMLLFESNEVIDLNQARAINAMPGVLDFRTNYTPIVEAK